jgi:hypothetical protein
VWVGNRCARYKQQYLWHYSNCSRSLFWHDLREFHKIIKENPFTQKIMQDLHTRTSYEHPKGTVIQAPLLQKIFKILTQGITGRPQDLLTRTCTRSCKGLLEDFTRISSRSSHNDRQKGFDQDLHAWTSTRISQDRHTAEG